MSQSDPLKPAKENLGSAVSYPRRVRVAVTFCCIVCLQNASVCTAVAYFWFFCLHCNKWQNESQFTVSGRIGILIMSVFRGVAPPLIAQEILQRV